MDELTTRHILPFGRGLRTAWMTSAFFAWTLLWSTAANGPLHGQVREGFEGGRPRWQLVESDCSAQISNQEITPSLPHSGQSCESMELVCTSGTYAYLAMPVEPCAVINELSPALWVQCSSSRIRLGIGVVFPNAVHPISGGRVHAVLWGTTYNDPGNWQRLSIADCESLLMQEILQQRQRLGSKLNFDGAYVDCIVVNAYTGPGRCRVKTDEFTMPGTIAMSTMGTAVPADWRARWRWRDGAGSEELRWSQSSSNRIPGWWQYQGESLPWLQSLGFQGLLLNRVPSDALLSEARSARLQVIAPPPSVPLAVDGKPWDGVKGWLVGAAVDTRGLESLKNEVLRVSQFPEPLRRPTLVEAMEDYWSFSRVVDELIVPVPAAYSAGSAPEKMEWLRANLQQTNRMGSGWVSLATDPLPGWLDQVKQAQGIVDPSGEPLEAIDAMLLRLQVARCVAAGARGFVFRSATPLDVEPNGGRVRESAMRMINRDLALLGPWIIGGQVAPVPQLSREDYAAASWTTSRSQLIMFVVNDAATSHSVPPTRDRPLRATMPLPSGIRHVLRVTGGAMQSLLLTPGSDGMSWEIPAPGPMEICVLTDNPVVERFLSRQGSPDDRSGPTQLTQAAEDMLNVANHQLLAAARITAARWPEAIDELSRRYYSTIQAAQQRVEQGYAQLRANRPSLAMEAGNQAYDAAQMIVHESYLTANSNLAAPQSSPLVLAPASLPYHWQLARSCERSTWRSLPLPASEFSSLPQMIEAGWSQQRRLNERAEVLVELVPVPAEANADAVAARVPVGLRLAALAKTGQQLPGGYEGASIRVRSAPSEVSQGELIRIVGRATIRRAPIEPGAGLLVYDNKGGPSLGQLIRGSAGQTVPIELYRFATDDQPLRVLTELRGSCDIILEGLSLSAIRPAVNATTYPTTPVSRTDR